MKAIFAGVASSAAIIRSPSFSRDSLSRTTTNSPRARASISWLYQEVDFKCLTECFQRILNGVEVLG